MEKIEELLKKYATILQICLIIISACFLSIGINRPLVDYDEATYAKVVVDTLQSGDVLSFTLSGNPWFEKPPLFLWLAMGSVKIFGGNEFAFRIPSILASILCLWLTYLIARKLTDSELVGLSAFLILMCSSVFFYYGREVRLDSGVIACILGALFYWIKAKENEKYLFWVIPLIALGFLFKSVIVLLIGPVLLIYSFFYQRWGWLRNKYLWYGLPIAIIIFAPWHILQIMRFGKDFLDRYIGYDVYKRATMTVTGNGKIYSYLENMWADRIWFVMVLGTIVGFIGILFEKKFRSVSEWKSVAAPLVTSVFIITIFSMAKTHLTPYIMTALPFTALFIALFGYSLAKVYRNRFLLLLIVFPIIIIGSSYCMKVIHPVEAYVFEEMMVGQMYKKISNDQPAPLYGLGWPYLETVNYYTDTKTEFLGADNMSGKKLKGPFYIVTTTAGASYFFYPYNGQLKSMYDSLSLLYLGKYAVLMYSSEDITFPVF